MFCKFCKLDIYFKPIFVNKLEKILRFIKFCKRDTYINAVSVNEQFQ